MLLIRYLIVAGLAYGIDLGGFILLLGLNYSPFVSNILVKVVAAIFGFFGHRYFTYVVTDNQDMSKHAIKYFGLALFYTPVSSIFLYLLMTIFPNPVYAKLMTDISLFVLMFWITSKYAFTKSNEGKNLTPNNATSQIKGSE
jgi:putative flippase GtrA